VVVDVGEVEAVAVVEVVEALSAAAAAVEGDMAGEKTFKLPVDDIVVITRLHTKETGTEWSLTAWPLIKAGRRTVVGVQGGTAREAVVRRNGENTERRIVTETGSGTGTDTAMIAEIATTGLGKVTEMIGGIETTGIGTVGGDVTLQNRSNKLSGMYLSS
jgi:hypothetical protein